MTNRCPCSADNQAPFPLCFLTEREHFGCAINDGANEITSLDVGILYERWKMETIRGLRLEKIVPNESVA